MKKGIYFTLCMLCYGVSIYAQKAKFITSGKITFEKKENAYNIISKILKDDNGEWAETVLDNYKKPENHFVTMKWDLYFKDSITKYKFSESNDAKNTNLWFLNNNSEDITYSNLEEKKSIREKHLFENVYRIQDSTRTIKWKLTNETREIAGITCKRANALIMDSIYVVAFYSEEILTQGGPETFNGLPGMILGIALPYDHVSWFATNVTTGNITEKEIALPKTGKIVTTKELITELQEPLKNWGIRGKMIMKNIQL